MADVGRIVLCAPEKNPNLTPVHEDETLALVCYVRTQASTDDAVPCWQIHLIKLSLNDLCDVVKNPSLLKGKSNAVNSMLLHTLIHIDRLNYCILSFLLLYAAMRVDKLGVSFSLPLFGLGCSSVSLSLTTTGFSSNVCRRHFNYNCLN